MDIEPSAKRGHRLAWLDLSSRHVSRNHIWSAREGVTLDLTRLDLEVGAKQTGSGRFREPVRGRHKYISRGEAHACKSARALVVYYVRTAYDGSPLGIGRLGIRSRFHHFIAPGYTRVYNTLSRDAHLPMIARSGQWMSAFRTYDFHHADTHIRFLLAKEEPL